MSQNNLKLHTTTHLLVYFPGTVDDPPYYVLTDKKRPELSTPAPITEQLEIKIQQLDNESKTLKLHLGDKDIGSYNTDDNTKATELADFVAAWRDSLALINSPSSSSSSSSNEEITPQHGRINTELRKKIDEFTKTETITMRAITWNMHGKPLSSTQLDALLGLPILSDMYVLCLQESDTLGPKNLYANTTTLANTKSSILEALGNEYSIIDSNQLLGLMVLIVARNKTKEQISDVRKDTTGTGLFGVWGNKGAAAVWLRFGYEPACPGSGVEMAVINCHLTAGDGKSLIERRAWEFGEIAKKLKVKGLVQEMVDEEKDDDEKEEKDDDDAKLMKVTDELASLDLDPSKKPITFLMGDLNYRVTMDSEMVADFSSKEDYETIIVQDQLGHSRKDDKILTGFTEGVINFAPTYKYVVGTDNFDNTERTPSYTDRIFYSADDRINQLEYKSEMQYNISDHKPVISKFQLTLPFIDFEKRKEIVDITLKDWDQKENSHRPVVAVEPSEITINDSKVLRPSEGWIKITHSETSTSGLIHWEILLCTEAGNIDNSSSPFVQVEPRIGDLPCGASQHVRITCTPGVYTPDISQIAIVKITDGQDIFVPIQFNSVKTCLGSSLDLLSRMPDGAVNGKIMDKASTNLPKEIWNCIDYLWTRITPEMFNQKGDSSLENQIQDWLDNGQPFDITVLEEADKIEPKISIYSVAQIFLSLLRYLQGGVIPLDYYHLVCKGSEGVNNILEQMPGVNVNVLIYITGFLHKAIDEGCDKKQLIELFDPLIISEPKNRDFLKRDKRKRREFLQSLINSN